MDTGHVSIRETGTITEITRGVVRLQGVSHCVLGQLIELRDVRGFVIGFTETEVLALLLGSESQLAVGQRVEVRPQPLRVPAGPELIGRVVSPLGDPLDGERAPVTGAPRGIFQDAPGILERSPIERQLCLGTKAIDAMIPVGRGQRELIIGDRMTGKTTLAIDAVLSQRDQQVLCIYCSIGQSQQKLRHVIHLLQERHALDYTMIVASPASQEASEQYLAPYAAAAMGEQFMAEGRDVLVIFDDLSKHAWAYRQLSLLLERPPGREAYPGDMFYIHAQLMERAGQLSEARGGGSMTFLPICETQQGDVTGYICSNLISMTDGQIYLSNELFYEGVKPAIDVGLSVSRIGNKVQPPILRWASGSLRLELVQYDELMRLSRFNPMTSEDGLRRLRRGALLRRLMRQEAHQPIGLDEQAVLLYAFQTGWLERISDEGLRVCLAGLTDRMPESVRTALREHQALSPLMQARLDDALNELLHPFTVVEGSTSHVVTENAPG